MGKQITKLDLQYFITIVLIRSGLVKDLIPSDVAHVGSLIPFKLMRSNEKRESV